jgi:hypothetical protein
VRHAIRLILAKPVLRLFVGDDATTNETIGLATAGFSLFYGLLLGLLTVAAYENRERIQLSILNEASAIGSIYSTVTAYPEPYRSDLKEFLRDYVQFTIHRDWDAHRAGKIAEGGNNRIQAFGLWLSKFEPKSASQEIMHSAGAVVCGDCRRGGQHASAFDHPRPSGHAFRARHNFGVFSGRDPVCHRLARRALAGR